MTAERLLERGRFQQIELIPWGSNYTFITVLADDGGESCLAVYKPRRGEVPLRDFPSGTLYKREVAAYVLARALAWPIVPLTLVRTDGPHGVGSVQLYKQPFEGAQAQFEQLRRTHRAELQRMATFDLLLNNADRKGGHCLLDEQQHIWGIDHGLTFHRVPKLRTVIWDYCEEPIPADLVAELATFRADAARVERLVEDLVPLLAGAEVEALLQRWDALLLTPCFPSLDPYRNVPWPPF